jgi:glycosyltransferase involved in cell wall biosynthesis
VSGAARTRPDGRLPDLVSVIVPVLNAEEHIGEQLAALAEQSYTGPWELVIVDNGSDDRSIAIAESFRDRFPSLTVADATGRRGLNHARNVGVSVARGDFVAFCDADDVVTEGWLAALAEAARHAEIVGGSKDLDTLNDGLARAAQPWDEPAGLLVELDFLPYVSGGNCGMWTSIAREIRWDEAFSFGSSDIEFAWRAQLAGYRLSFEPRAVLRQRLKRGLGALARQYYAYGKSDPLLHRRFRAFGLEPGPRRMRAHWRWLAVRAPDLFRGHAERAAWVRVASRQAGRLVGTIAAR